MFKTTDGEPWKQEIDLVRGWSVFNLVKEEESYDEEE